MTVIGSETEMIPELRCLLEHCQEFLPWYKKPYLYIYLKHILHLSKPLIDINYSCQN